VLWAELPGAEIRHLPGRTAIATYGRNWQIDFMLFYSSVSLSKVRQNYTTKIWQASKNVNFDQKSAIVSLQWFNIQHSNIQLLTL